jgi:hypothetical protein
VSDGQITEVEHIISTRRNLSSPPTPIGEPGEFAFDPVIAEAVPAAQRASREALAAHLNGYFDTLQHNDGEIRGTCFHPRRPGARTACCSRTSSAGSARAAMLSTTASGARSC